MTLLMKLKIQMNQWLIQEEKVQTNVEKGAQISITAKRILMQG